jgi:hypothetical protein
VGAKAPIINSRDITAVVISLGKPKHDDEGKEPMDSESAEGEVSEEAIAAGKDLADAVKTGDGETIALAFKALMDCCKEY